MKNNELEKLKPIYIHESSYSTEDEINLLNLAIMLVRRKKMVLAITIFISAAGIILALMTPKSYTFSTSIEIGSQIIEDSIEPFESPETLLAKIQHVFIPQTLRKQRQANPENKGEYKITIDIPKDSVIITLKVKGTEENADLMINILHKITQQAVLDHSRIYNAIKKNVTSQINLATDEVEALRKSNDKAELVNQQNIIEAYRSQITNLRMTREISPPMKSLEPTGFNQKLIIVLSIFLGLFIAVLSVFFAEFASKVRMTIKENKA
jgi:LPS O-antigen subunit length determinant protein (WzzB/FepE family)